MSFGGLYTSISGLKGAQYSLNTVSHNISNANNPNYVRQSVILGDNSYRNIGGGNVQGTGVHVREIRQIRDEFLDIQVRRELPGLGYFSGKAEVLADVEEIFNEITNSGLQNVMNDFWNSWNELQKDPSELTIRAIVHESSVAMVDTVNHLGGQLNKIQINLNKKVEDSVDRVNQILKEIAEINKAVKLVEGSQVKERANDFRDQRNALIDELSMLVPVKVYENHIGESVVSLRGQDMVNGDHISLIELDKDSSGFSNLYFAGTKDQIDLDGLGAIAGYIEVRDGSVENYKGQLNNLVAKVAEKINEIHKGGKDLLGEEGINFFINGETGDENGIGAYNIRVNPDLADLNKIAVSKSGEIGDGSLARSIYEIRQLVDKDFLIKEGSEDQAIGIDDYYRDIITNLGLERQSAISFETSQYFLIKSIDEKRSEISNVSLDEEMADMIKFQHSYVANSRVINAIDEMIDTIVNRLGLVGR